MVFISYVLNLLFVRSSCKVLSSGWTSPSRGNVHYCCVFVFHIQLFIYGETLGLFSPNISGPVAVAQRRKSSLSEEKQPFVEGFNPLTWIILPKMAVCGVEAVSRMMKSLLLTTLSPSHNQCFCFSIRSEATMSPFPSFRVVYIHGQKAKK